jgi:hypothetical protein
MVTLRVILALSTGECEPLYHTPCFADVQAFIFMVQGLLVFTLLPSGKIASD